VLVFVSLLKIGLATSRELLCSAIVHRSWCQKVHTWIAGKCHLVSLHVAYHYKKRETRET
jgi:hypothetical protein